MTKGKNRGKSKNSKYQKNWKRVADKKLKNLRKMRQTERVQKRIQHYEQF